MARAPLLVAGALKKIFLRLPLSCSSIVPTLVPTYDLLSTGYPDDEISMNGYPASGHINEEMSGI